MSKILPFNRVSLRGGGYPAAIQSLVMLGELKVEQRHRLPFFLSKVSAGFPSPADDYLEKKISLDELILENPASSYIVQAQGNSMTGVGIKDKSYLVVDRSLQPQNGDIVIVSINNEHTVKTFKRLANGQVFLCPENPDYETIELKEDLESILFGVVTCIMLPTRK